MTIHSLSCFYRLCINNHSLCFVLIVFILAILCIDKDFLLTVINFK